MSEMIAAQHGPTPQLERAWTLAQTALGFVAWLARDYTHTGLPREDLESEGRLGLMDAALRFDPGHGVQFATYASWWARRRMQNLVHNQSRIVRRPLSRSRGGYEPRDVSLDAPVSARDAQRWSDILADGSAAPLESILQDEGAALVARATGQLPPLWRTIVVQRYGLDGAPPRTLAAIGGRLGGSRERVRQIESKAIDRMRRCVASAWSVSAGGGRDRHAGEHGE